MKTRGLHPSNLRILLESKVCAREANIVVAYASHGGRAHAFAHQLVENLVGANLGCTVAFRTLNQISPLIEHKQTDKFLIVVSSTTTAGGCPENGRTWFDLLNECANDHRVEGTRLRNWKYAVIGFGDAAHGRENFCLAAKNMHLWLQRLGAVPVMRMMALNVDVAADKTISVLCSLAQKYVSGMQSPDRAEDDPLTPCEHGDCCDDEDAIIEASPQCTTQVSEKQRRVLQKQGYKLVGTHSATKLCRWTKSQLRGRGGCYKHTFYGINSHQCMEATCSIACANRCTFCWRHHTNTVATSWSWQTDEPSEVLNGMLTEHKALIKTLNGMAGVKEAGRIPEGQVVRHCALSLVGEPIMYPRISEFLNELHMQRISSFLVSNAQFPEQLRALEPCTQLYLSIDAPNKDLLKKIDRPLFSDYWERLLSCLDVLKERRERTVFRMTLVKGQNDQELENYASLIERGLPDFVELKGVTYSGVSCDLSMSQVPFHSEVKRFAMELVEAIDQNPRIKGQYDLALEHEHSCAVLIANIKYRNNGVWNTWIDFDKFFAWEAEHKRTGGTGHDSRGMDGIDYSCETPPWAFVGSPERGFDPREFRYHKPRGHPST